jgi:predicted  nucleic acid-binding Zn-ribbon protein
MTWVCENCTARYAEPLPACPHCGSTERHANHEEESMPKATVEGGPSNAAAEQDAPGQEAELPPPPPASAPKAEHVKYATEVLGLSSEDAEAQTKAKLAEAAHKAAEGEPDARKGLKDLLD